MSDNNVNESMELAAYIRKINGDNRMGAAMLAEKVLEWQAARAQSIQSTQPVAWGFCPECGSDDANEYPDMLRVCNDCGQDWHADVDYTDAIRANLSRANVHPQPAQQGRVPDYVNEALQRLIENGGNLGPASREDALVVAQYRRELLTTPQTEGDGWVKCSERLPTEADGDWDGQVIVLDDHGEMACTNWSVATRKIITHWKPTGLKRPQPPKEGE